MVKEKKVSSKGDGEFAQHSSPCLSVSMSVFSFLQNECLEPVLSPFCLLSTPFRMEDRDSVLPSHAAERKNSSSQKDYGWAACLSPAHNGGKVREGMVGETDPACLLHLNCSSPWACPVPPSGREGVCLFCLGRKSFSSSSSNYLSSSLNNNNNGVIHRITDIVGCRHVCFW